MSSVSSTSSTTDTTSTTTTDSTDLLGKEDFLTLMIAEMENQDPLDPTDATEYTNQLVQYSNLEQLINLNETVEGMVDSVGTATNATALNMLGNNVAYYDDTLEYDGESSEVDLGYYLDDTASSVSIEIQLNGNTVATIVADEMEEGDHYVTWDGLTDEGEQAEAGEYTIEVTATDSEGETVSSSPIVSSEVVSVEMSDGIVGGIVTSTGSIDLDNVIGVLGS